MDRTLLEIPVAGAPLWLWLVVPATAALAVLLAWVALAGARGLWRRRVGLAPASLVEATARVLYRLMVDLYRTEQTTDEPVAASPGQIVLVADTANRLYDALSDTITVRFDERLVPVPLKILLPRQQFVNALTAAFVGPQAGFARVQAGLALAFEEAGRRGITNERLLAYGIPRSALLS